MRAVARIMSTKELYPPKPGAEAELAHKLRTNDRDPGGRYLLRRALTGQERKELHARRELLNPFLTKGMYREIEPVIVELFNHYNSRGATMKETAVTAQTYARVLGDLPLWAIKRACDRFTQNRVEPEEIGAKTIDASAPPSSGAIHTVARNLLFPVADEFNKLWHVLAGAAPPAPMSKEERDAAAATIEGIADDVRKKFAEAALAEKVEEEKRAASRRARALARNVVDRRRSYEAHGVEPPAGENFASLPMMLHMGYQIEEVARGKSALVPPRRPVPGPIPERPRR